MYDAKWVMCEGFLMDVSMSDIFEVSKMCEICNVCDVFYV